MRGQTKCHKFLARQRIMYDIKHKKKQFNQARIMGNPIKKGISLTDHWRILSKTSNTCGCCKVRRCPLNLRRVQWR